MSIKPIFAWYDIWVGAHFMLTENYARAHFEARNVLDRTGKSPEKLVSENEWLSQREDDALKLLHSAFGEYACMIKAHLSEKEIAEFETNFAVPARAFIGAKRFGR